MSSIISSEECTMHESIEKLPPMLHYRSLGRCGLRVSNIGLGTWVNFSQMSEETAQEVLTTAYEHGINIFDTAESYSNGSCEIMLGKVLKSVGWRRSSYIVVTKVFWGGKAETERGLSRKHIIEGVKASLERLQLSYVDLVLAAKNDPFTPVEEIVRSFTQLISDGLCFYWGTSRWSAAEIMDAYSVARQFNLIPPVADHMEYNWLSRERAEFQMPEMVRKIGLGGIACSPLAGGYLTGKYEDGIPSTSRAALKGFCRMREKILSEDGRHFQTKLHDLKRIAQRLSCSVAQLAIAWCLKNEYIHCVLMGAVDVEQLQENIRAVTIVAKLTPGIMEEIEIILREGRGLGILEGMPLSRHISHIHNSPNGL